VKERGKEEREDRETGLGQREKEKRRKGRV
jgi:hypothetical protein